MGKLNVTQKDITAVKLAVASFNQSIISGAGGLSAAREKFKKSMFPGEDFVLGNMRTSLDTSSPEKETESYLKYCEAVLPVMQRAFGYDAVLRAMPTNPVVIDLCRNFGANALANLCEKARQLKAKSCLVIKPWSRGPTRSI